MSYRACWYITPDAQGEMRLTLPEHARLSDDALIREAMAEAVRADLVGEDVDPDDDNEPRLTFAQLLAGLQIQGLAYTEHDHSVDDAEGGSWLPSADAVAEIEAADDPAACAVRICHSEPMRGEWRS